ncbi:hypothetical protein V7S43_014534 [Phytophthora oleae]|uniref:Uncharacterized protein n=1 Tax=Phytophthora oleae TaxID=2107226 RepID=A0ABD3F1L8_9STRA
MDSTIKKFKPSHVKRKEEKQQLKNQVQVLQKQVDELSNRVRMTRSDEELDLWKTKSSKRILERAIHDQQMNITQTQIKMLQIQENMVNNPLYRPIHLPKEWNHRRGVLVGMKDEMISRGLQYTAARSEPLDLGKAHFSDQVYENDNGDVCCDRFEFIHFNGVKSVEQVYEALKFFVDNMEISISEKLGHMTVREGYDSEDGGPSITNFHLVSKPTEDLTVEINNVTCMEYFERHRQFDGPCGVMVTDNVDTDELYPYCSRDRVRRDVSVAIVLTELTPNPRELGCTRGREKVTVLMQRAAFLTIRNPEFKLSASSMDSLREGATGTSSWGDVTVQAIREYVKAN